MENDLPPDSASVPRAAGPGRRERPSSPWELDLGWQEAPRDLTERRPPPATAPSPVPEARAAETHRPALARGAAFPVLWRGRGSRERGGAWPAIILLSVGLLLFVFVAWQYLHDAPRGSDDDLRPARALDQTPVVKMPQKLKRFLDSVVPPPGGRLPASAPWRWDTPALARFFKGNGAALDNLRDLLEDLDWHPAHAAWHAVDLGSDPRWSIVFALKQAECAYLLRLGQEEGAFRAALDLADLARSLEEIWAWPSFYTRSLEARELAAQALAELLKQTRLPEPVLKEFQQRFSLSLPVNETLVQALAAFYLHEKKVLFGPASGEPLDTMPGGAQLRRPGRLFFKPHLTLQLFVDRFRHLRMETQAPLANTGLIRLQGTTAPPARGFQPNAAGESYCAARMEVYSPLPAQLGLAKTRSALVLTLFAVRRCVAEQHALPPSLENLQPKYLPELPQDPFSAAPLHYDIRRGWIWSVGNDLQSQGGAPTSPPMEEAKEPTVEIGIGIAAAVQ